MQPGVGGEIQLTDAIALLLVDQAVYGDTFEDGRFDTGTVIAYLKTIVELALAREGLGRRSRRVPRRAGRAVEGSVDPISARPGPTCSPAARPDRPSASTSPTRWAGSWPSRSSPEEPVPPFDNSAMDGFAVRAADVAGATDDQPVRLEVVDTVAAGAAPERYGRGRARRCAS